MGIEEYLRTAKQGLVVKYKKKVQRIMEIERYIK